LAQEAPYRISPGDELSVTYPYNPELNLTGPVGPDGRFVVPMVGNLPVAGQTLDDVAADISARLRSGGIVADARPVVSIRTYGAVVYVGERSAHRARSR
jgi:protein involved in polysaccharide export with SLBB domain